MTDYPETAARFARDTAQHQMTVLHDDGLYRHLKFMNPGHGSIGSFELITWPYNLVVKAGWVFAFDIDATPDMFELFRRTALKGQINPGYWQEKVRAGRDEVVDYNPELLKANVEDYVKGWVEDAADDDFEQKLRAAVHGHFFSDTADYNVEFEAEALRALSDFDFDTHYKATCICGMEKRCEYDHDARLWRISHLRTFDCKHPKGDDPVAIKSVEGYRFHEFYEWQMKSFTPGFIHSCYAIRHGIDVWDAARAPQAAAS
ncbi:hypothetical protein [Streptomyces sp. NPDC048256]|uniref:hypothetical protein n=1 Tax=Streptomyces sp. NPDC048256 TaxID=3154613 RepID=UPI0033ECF937